MKTTICVIHCTELPERTEGTRRHFAEVGITPVWWRAAHGRTWGLETRLEYESGQRITPGHVSLNLAHWNLWLHLQQIMGPDDEAIICEDDVIIPPTFDSDLKRVRADLRSHMPDWQFCFIGLAESEPGVWHKITHRVGDGDSRLCRGNDLFGTHAYLIKPSALPVLIDNMTKAERNMDQQLFQYVLKPNKLKWCAVLPTIIKQRTFDYGGNGKPEWAPSTLHPDDNKPLPAAVHPTAAVGNEREMNQQFGGTLGVPDHYDPDQFRIVHSVIDPFPCIYRGEGADPGLTESGRGVPLSQCAFLGIPCHTKAGKRVTTVDGTPVKDCQSCTLRDEMHVATAKRPRLPVPEGHFNPSMLLYRGDLILATRDNWGHSHVALWKLTNTQADWSGSWSAAPIGSYASNHVEAPKLEDPRLFLAPHPDHGIPVLHSMFNLPDGHPPKKVNVGYVRFAKDLSGIEHTEVFRSPRDNAYEKNWVPFVHGGSLHWVYSSKPDHVVIDEAGRHVTPNPLPWAGGVIRGGAAPVLHHEPDGSGVYYHFFHGCLKRVQGSVYTLGCLVFEAKPPFRVLRQTPRPLAWPDRPGEGENVIKRFVLWPGGVVPYAGHWHVAYGIDDTYCRIDRIPFATVENAMTDVPDETARISIGNTPMAKGVKEEERP